MMTGQEDGNQSARIGLYGCLHVRSRSKAWRRRCRFSAFHYTTSPRPSLDTHNVGYHRMIVVTSSPSSRDQVKDHVPSSSEGIVELPSSLAAGPMAFSCYYLFLRNTTASPPPLLDCRLGYV